MERVIAYGGEFCNGMCRGSVDHSVFGWMLATFGIFFVFMIALALAVFGFWVWMLVDAVKRDEASYKKIGNGEKSLWIIILVVSLLVQMLLVGALIYFFLIYQKDKPVKEVQKKK